MNAGRLTSIQIGPVASLGPESIPSGFVKSTVEGPVRVTVLGLAGDEQADLSVHGGPEKAVYAYPAAHYPVWASEYPHHVKVFVPGGVGENLTIGGLVETDLCVGDIHAIGTARLQLCQPRQPCFKFSLRFDDNQLPKAMVRNGRAGWYYRVVEEGMIRSGDTVALIDRPNPAFGFDRLVEIVNRRHATAAELVAMDAMDGLASGLRRWARGALDKG